MAHKSNTEMYMALDNIYWRSPNDSSPYYDYQGQGYIGKINGVKVPNNSAGRTHLANEINGQNGLTNQTLEHELCKFIYQAKPGTDDYRELCEALGGVWPYTSYIGDRDYCSIAAKFMNEKGYVTCDFKWGSTPPISPKRLHPFPDNWVPATTDRLKRLLKSYPNHKRIELGLDTTQWAEFDQSVDKNHNLNFLVAFIVLAVFEFWVIGTAPEYPLVYLLLPVPWIVAYWVYDKLEMSGKKKKNATEREMRIARSKRDYAIRMEAEKRKQLELAAAKKIADEYAPYSTREGNRRYDNDWA